MMLLIASMLTGCKNNFFPAPDEIEHFEIVQVVGIDKSEENPSDIEVTFISKLEKSSTSEKSGGGTTVITVMSSTAPTAFEAERKIKASSEKTMYFGQVNYYLIGGEAAREDFTKYFDFITRDHETRLSPKIYITKDCSAKELISTTSSNDEFIADRLEGIKSDLSEMSNTEEIRMIDVLGMLDHTESASVIPAIKCSEIKDKQSTGQLPEKEICTAGYAVLKDFKLAGYIERAYSRGYNFLVNEMGSCPFTVKDSSGMNVALEVISAKTKVEAHFDGNDLTGVTYRTHVVSNVPEQQSRNQIFTESEMRAMNTQQANLIKAEMERVIDLSKELGIDCTKLGQTISMTHPFKWNHLKDSWTDLYPTLNIDIVVVSEIARSYEIHEPNGTGK